MTDAAVSKPENESAKYEQRNDAFYTQTISENNARLESKIPAGAVLDELKFIQSQLLMNFSG